MTDTNDMRREFDAWLNSSKAVNGYDSDLFHAWQAATERATAIERERCAVVCEGRVYALDHAGKQYRREWTASQCADAIRQGGAT